jgi:pilus assembly protein Flp/PilA
MVTNVHSSNSRKIRSTPALMRRTFLFITEFRPVKSEAGVTAIEYGLIAALIAIAIVTSVTLFATNMSTTFTNIAGRL